MTTPSRQLALCALLFAVPLFPARAQSAAGVITPVTPDSVRFEQAYSDDWGRSWVPNWIATDTRMKERAEPR